MMISMNVFMIVKMLKACYLEFSMTAHIHHDSMVYLLMVLHVVHDDVINWKLLSELLALCAGNSPITGEFPSVTRSFDVLCDLRLNKRLSKQSRRRWFETQSLSLWRHCNVLRNNTQATHWLLSLIVLEHKILIFELGIFSRLDKNLLHLFDTTLPIS